jgi:hypothetical protein
MYEHLKTLDAGFLQNYYRSLIGQDAQADHDGDRVRRAEIQAEIAAFKIEWSRRGNGPLDGSTGWPRTPRQHAAQTVALHDAVRKLEGTCRDDDEAAARVILADHIAHGAELGYPA